MSVKDHVLDGQVQAHRERRCRKEDPNGAASEVALNDGPLLGREIRVVKRDGVRKHVDERLACVRLLLLAQLLHRGGHRGQGDPLREHAGETDRRNSVG